MSTLGIDEAAVHAAAKALIREGESPTGEAIVARIGGSKTTVYKYLRTFWPRLADHLDEENPLPELPGQIGRLAGELWQAAMDAATEVADKKLAAARRAADDARERGNEALQSAHTMRADAESRVETADRALARMRVEREAALSEVRRLGQVVTQLQEELGEKQAELRSVNKELVARAETIERVEAAHASEIERMKADRDRESGSAMAQLDRTRTDARKAEAALRSELDAMRARLDQMTKQQIEQAREIATLQSNLNAALQSLRAERDARRALESTAPVATGTAGASPGPARPGFTLYRVQNSE